MACLGLGGLIGISLAADIPSGESSKHVLSAISIEPVHAATAIPVYANTLKWRLRAGQISKIQFLQQNYEVCNFFRAIDLSQ